MVWVRFNVHRFTWDSISICFLWFFCSLLHSFFFVSLSLLHTNSYIISGARNDKISWWTRNELSRDKKKIRRHLCGFMRILNFKRMQSDQRLDFGAISGGSRGNELCTQKPNSVFFIRRTCGRAGVTLSWTIFDEFGFFLPHVWLVSVVIVASVDDVRHPVN